ncbi:Tat pathway signal sequence domain protein [Streptomyces sp. NPDC057697]|uniref:Tat pathway signal sequence domain protein n=1 Tax=Streptomyces sp. NPDC057697 TaxID=3346219 RepID=UPI00369F754F
MTNPSGRAPGGAAADGAVAAAGLPAPAHTASWSLRRSPSASGDGPGVFGTVEDDRAGARPAGRPRSRTEGDGLRFITHTADRGAAADRRCQEASGPRTGGGPYLTRLPGETRRIAHRTYNPGSSKAATGSTHIMRMKQPGNGTSPAVVRPPRRVNGARTIEPLSAGVPVGRTDPAPPQDRRIGVDVRITIGDGTSGAVRRIPEGGAAPVVDVSASGADAFLGDRVRPERGIRRSPGGTSGSSRDTRLLLARMRGYRLV